MRTRARWLGLSAAGIAAAAMTLMAVTATVEAIPSQDVIRVYYKTSSKRVPVGEKLILSCGGRVNQMIWGRTSRYSKDESYECDTVPPFPPPKPWPPKPPRY